MINHSAIKVRLNLPRVYPITDRRLSGLSHAEQVTRLIEGGATLIQLRDKHSTPAEFYREAAAALKVAREQGVRLIINDRVDIALALNADGVHLGQTDMPAEAARRLLGPQAIIGFSTHNLEQAKRATALPVDYLAFGPVFPTSTKEHPDPTTGLDALREISAIKGSMPLVAIGGISFETGIEVLESGADSLSLIAQLLSESSLIVQNMSKILALTSITANNSSPR